MVCAPLFSVHKAVAWDRPYLPTKILWVTFSDQHAFSFSSMLEPVAIAETVNKLSCVAWTHPPQGLCQMESWEGIHVQGLYHIVLWKGCIPNKNGVMSCTKILPMEARNSTLLDRHGQHILNTFPNFDWPSQSYHQSEGGKQCLVPAGCHASWTNLAKMNM